MLTDKLGLFATVEGKASSMASGKKRCCMIYRSNICEYSRDTTPIYHHSPWERHLVTHESRGVEGKISGGSTGARLGETLSRIRNASRDTRLNDSTSHLGICNNNTILRYLARKNLIL